MSIKTWIVEKLVEGKFPNFVYRLIGKQIANKIDLKETNMADETEKIAWYKSKSIWVAVIGAILGAVQPISAAFGHPIVIPNWVFELLAGMGLYSLRTATTAIK
jgi:hypothetical protein